MAKKTWKNTRTMPLTVIIVSMMIIGMNFKPNSGSQEQQNAIYSIEVSTSYTETDFKIDNADPSYNWTATVNNKAWCSGTGTFEDPYVVSDVIFNIGEWSWCKGLTIKNSDDVFFRVENCIFNGTGSYTGLFIQNSFNGTITNCNFTNAYHGLYISSCSDLIIQNIISMNNSRGMTIDSSLYTYISENTVKNNTDRGLVLLNSENIDVDDNIVESNDMFGIDIDSSSYCNITDNLVRFNQYFAIGTEHTENDHIILENNTIESNEYGVELTNSNYSSIIGNKISKNTGNGIVYRGNSSLIADNFITEQTSSAIVMQDSNDIHVYNNTLITCNEGIDLIDVTNTIINKNNISDNTDYGMFTRNTCDDLDIFNNTIEENYIGIMIYDGTYQDIEISRNFFIENDYQANNQYSFDIDWSNGTIGNYWSDYDELFTATDVDDDGIGDVPYTRGHPSNINDPYPIYEDGANPAPMFSETPDSQLILQTDNGENTIQWIVTDVQTINPSYFIEKNSTGIISGVWSSGTPIELNLQNYDEGIYNFTIHATDGVNINITNTAIVTVNHKPNITGPAPSEFIIQTSDTNSVLTFTITDGLIDNANYTFLVDGESYDDYENLPWLNNTEFEIDLDDFEGGQYSCLLISEDGYGGISQEDFTLIVNINPNIQVDQNSPYIFQVGSEGNSLGYQVFDNETNNPIYTVLKNGTEYSAEYTNVVWIDEYRYTIDLDNLNEGFYNISTTFSDGYGGLIQDDVLVIANDNPEIISGSTNDLTFSRGTSGNTLTVIIKDNTIGASSYRFLGDDSELIDDEVNLVWQNGTEFEINFDNLPKGNYQIEIEFSDGFGGTVTYDINITVEISSNLWWIVLMILEFGLVATGFTVEKVQTKKTKKRDDSEIEDLVENLDNPEEITSTDVKEIILTEIIEEKEEKLESKEENEQIIEDAAKEKEHLSDEIDEE